MARANAAIDKRAATRREAFGHIGAARRHDRYDLYEATLRSCLPYFIAVFLGILAFVGNLARLGRLPRTRPIVPGEIAVSD